MEKALAYTAIKSWQGQMFDGTGPWLRVDMPPSVNLFDNRNREGNAEFRMDLTWFNA